MKPVLLPLLTAAAWSLSFPVVRAAETVFVEAESLQHLGGWSLDTAFTQLMGSPFLLAHGLGKPVADATGSVRLKEGGTYRIWVRTKDWVAPWKAPGTPGRFQVLVHGKPLAQEFGTVGADWHWQPGGSLELTPGEVPLALHDLSGFDGRCDALLLSNDPHFSPPEGDALGVARKKWLNPEDAPPDAGAFDLVVVGGGYAGLATAISAARQSLRVALVQDRFVLGGNGSSEIGVWAQGGTMRGKFPHIGEIVEEFADRSPDSPGPAEHFADDRKEKVCRAEKNLSLFLGHFAQGVVQESPGGRITAVTALDVRSGRERVFRGKLFADCTGHGTVGALAGAAFTLQEKGHMGMSNLWYYQQEDSAQAWPETPWALPLEVGDFPKTPKSKSEVNGKPFFKGEWFWEGGFDKHPITELELVRDWNLRAVFGAFSALKRGEKASEYANAALKWVGHVGGTRESRLLQGDVVLTQDDIVQRRDFPDGFVPTTWDIDLHYPREQYAKKFPDAPFISRAEFGRHVDRKNGYPIPYRCFYSKNVPNLFMAGRNISVTREALGTIRVMRTCGMMGEIVGKAAYLAVLHGTTPRGVYESHLPELIKLAELPGATRRDSLQGEPRLDPSVTDLDSLPVGSMNRDLPKYASRFTPEAGAGGLKNLPGIIVDDTAAILSGSWSHTTLEPHVGGGARYAHARSNALARFEFKVPSAGKYELRLLWAGHDNRASNTLVHLEKAGHPTVEFRLNQRLTPPNGAHSLGVHELAPGSPCAVVVSSADADGFVVADAIQILPVP